LAAVKESIPDRDLVLIAMGGLPSDWSPFVKGTCARGQIPSFDQFWSKCIQEETRENVTSSKEKEEEMVLATKTGKKKGKQNKGRRDFRPRQNSKFKKEGENPKYYTCGKPRYIAANCWKKKGKGKHNASVAKEKHAPEKKTPTDEPRKDYFLVTALSGSISDSDV